MPCRNKEPTAFSHWVAKRVRNSTPASGVSVATSILRWSSVRMLTAEPVFLLPNGDYLVEIYSEQLVLVQGHRQVLCKKTSQPSIIRLSFFPERPSAIDIQPYFDKLFFFC